MKKILVVCLVVFLSLILSNGVSNAVSGQCAVCHTMHNSQDNSCQAIAWNGSGTELTCTPQPKLLKGNCLGCHASTTGNTIIGGIPIVYNTGAYPAQPLAGGNFYDVRSGGTDSHGHNVSVISGADGVLLTPPGFTDNGGNYPSSYTATTPGQWGPAAWGSGSQVTCAGEYGCHGSRATGLTDYSALQGGHHYSKHAFSDLDGSTVGKSYRFLAGIQGAEESDWEQTATSGKHNGYYGVSDYSSDATISYLCGECHGQFHANSNLGGTANVGSESPWLRHPTDVALNFSDSSTFTTDYTTYNTETPVGYTSPTTNVTVVNTSSIVICLSCHSAHGTQQPDILRFDYSTQLAGQGATNGCLRCHTGVR
jgi:hypothetical protein